MMSSQPLSQPSSQDSYSSTSTSSSVSSSSSHYDNINLVDLEGYLEQLAARKQKLVLTKEEIDVRKQTLDVDIEMNLVQKNIKRRLQQQQQAIYQQYTVAAGGTPPTFLYPMPQQPIPQKVLPPIQEKPLRQPPVSIPTDIISKDIVLKVFVPNIANYHHQIETKYKNAFPKVIFITDPKKDFEYVLLLDNTTRNYFSEFSQWLASGKNIVKPEFLKTRELNPDIFIRGTNYKETQPFRTLQMYVQDVRREQDFIALFQMGGIRLVGSPLPITGQTINCTKEGEVQSAFFQRQYVFQILYNNLISTYEFKSQEEDDMESLSSASSPEEQEATTALTEMLTTTTNTKRKPIHNESVNKKQKASSSK